MNTPVTKKIIIEKFVLNRGKTVVFNTYHIFTAGHRTSQRSESLNFLKCLCFETRSDNLEYI